jgi:hypothetical protein
MASVVIISELSKYVKNSIICSYIVFIRLIELFGKSACTNDYSSRVARR